MTSFPIKYMEKGNEGQKNLQNLSLRANHELQFMIKKSSSTRLLKTIWNTNSFQMFQQVNIIKLQASTNNYCPQLYFKTQLVTLAIKLSPWLHIQPRFLEMVHAFVMPQIVDYNIMQWCSKKLGHLGTTIPNLQICCWQ